MTIKELRARDAARLAERKNPNPTPAEYAESIQEARHAMRLFYIFAAAFQRSFFTSQEPDTSEKERAAADEKSEKTYKRAADALKAYNLKISCPGLYPIITELNGEHWSQGFWYN